MENVRIFATPAAYEILLTPENDEQVRRAVQSVLELADNPEVKPCGECIFGCPIGLTCLWANESRPESTILLFQTDECYDFYSAHPEKFHAVLKSAIPVSLI